jgi:N,N'-diacetyllegionaminate synthase
MKTLIIAEAGVNHNGSISVAKRLIKIAAKSGADIVKFQTFTAENTHTKNAKKANYLKKSTKKKQSFYSVIKSLELSAKDQIKLKKECRLNKIEFLSTAFDIDSIKLVNRIGVKRFKIPSGEINNLPYLRFIGKFNKKIILSTGMSSFEEIQKALKILINSGTNKKKITVLQCNTEYPTPYHDVNLRVMEVIKKRLKVEVGYSDHTSGIETPIAAVALGAKIIEKHFTLSRKMVGPDHSASIEPNELRTMIQSIRNVEKTLGVGIKKLTKSEYKNLKIVRKSIVAKTNIKKGEKFSKKNITVKRPAKGLSPMKWDSVIGKISKKNYKIDNFIKI